MVILCVKILHKLQSDIQTFLNKTEVTLSVMADYSKVLVTVTYSTLIKKVKGVKV